jgi:negative regulator of flagellin synthesis FlgM
MKINDVSKKVTDLPVTPGQPRSGRTVEKTETTPGSSTDNVSLSSQAQALAKAGGSAAVFDAGKVEEIKAAIAGGSFRVDTERVADGLIESVRELIGAHKK